jgi:hypothetical protein
MRTPSKAKNTLYKRKCSVNPILRPTLCPKLAKLNLRRQWPTFRLDVNANILGAMVEIQTCRGAERPKWKTMERGDGRWRQTTASVGRGTRAINTAAFGFASAFCLGKRIGVH